MCTLLLLTALLSTFTACGDDDDDDDSILSSEDNSSSNDSSDNENNTDSQDEDSDDLTVTGYINGHAYVDLNLSVNWATCNIGADSPEDYGDYYAWGETETKDEYTIDNSVTYEKTGMDDDISANSKYDAARANWRSTWRMPTSDELSELISNCTCSWTVQNNVIGYKITGSNGNSIFLPAAGMRTPGYSNGTSTYHGGSRGYYWSSSPRYGGNYIQAQYLGFDYSDISVVVWGERFSGFTIRPVSDR